MPPTNRGPSHPPVLTPEQALDVLRTFAPNTLLLLVAIPGPEHPKPSPPPLHELERFVVERPKLLSKLITFYFIGCAYSDGAGSLHAVSKELFGRKQAKTLTPVPPHCTSALSVLLRELAADPFAVYLRQKYLTLLEYAEGQPGVLSTDGWTAWEATRDYLAQRGLLPPW